MSENKTVLVVVFHIVWVTDHFVNKDTKYFRFPYKFVISKGLLFFVSTRAFRLLGLLLSSQTLDSAHNYEQGR